METLSLLRSRLGVQLHSREPGEQNPEPVYCSEHRRFICAPRGARELGRRGANPAQVCAFACERGAQVCRATTKEDRPNFQTEISSKGGTQSHFFNPLLRGVEVGTGEGLQGSQSPPAWRPGTESGQSRGSKKGLPHRRASLESPKQ